MDPRDCVNSDGHEWKLYMADNTPYHFCQVVGCKRTKFMGRIYWIGV